MARMSTSVEPGSRVRPLRVALPKGVLFEAAVTLLEEAGFGIAGLASPGRRLTLDADGMTYVLAKPADIPVYVAHGGADCGVVGKDTLAESALDVAELVDLGFGRCRFVVAEPEEAAGDVEERYRHLGVLRVATKYPRVAEEYFAGRGIQVEIVKLHGNIELAPLVGVADRIVDITATGRTLADNRLRIVDEVLTSTARFVANSVSAKIDPRVTAMAERLATAARSRMREG